MTDENLSNLGPDEQPIRPDAPAVPVPAPAQTVGVSPKLIAAVVTAILTYLLGQTVLELPAVAVVIGQAVLVALAAWAAAPGDTVARDDETGQVDLGTIVAVLAIVVLVLVIVRIT